VSSRDEVLGRIRRELGPPSLDTLAPKPTDQSATGLAGIGRSFEDVVAIVLTHSHRDHAGGAAAVKAASDARVYATAVDAPAIEGAEKPPPPPVATAWYGWPLKLVLAAMSPPPAVTVDHLVAESTGDLLPGDLRAIDTPGHTPGHASFLLDRDGGLVFVGDAARGTRDGRRVTRGFFNRPDPTLDESIRHLAELDFEVAVFGHSGPVRAGASSIFRSFAASLS
jgi:glyoxylase-like metal-dependent hydrolase (beta-lactamase superfamily II)